MFVFLFLSCFVFYCFVLFCFGFVLHIFDGVVINEWVSNMLILRLHLRLAYWAPIHYDTVIEDGQNKRKIF